MLLATALYTFVGAAAARAIGTVTNHDTYQNRSAQPRIDLGYATYEGSALSNGINQFLGMRYAAPPTGDRRFRRPEAPLHQTGITSAKEHGSVCYGVASTAGSGPQVPYSEDCLFIDLYVPGNATATKDGGLPVMLWIQGGAFVELFNPNYNGTGLIEAAGGNAIVASFNYRVGPYGFLASDQLKTEQNLNVGLHDQRAAIQWIQRYISNFGGDPNKVTLFGTSVGGGSVLLQLLAYGGQPPATESDVEWSAGIAQAVYLPSVYSVDDMEFHYRDFLKATNCTDMDCLRSLPSEEFQAANVAVPFPGQEDTPLFGYGPVLDGSLLPAQPLALLKQGRFLKDKPMIVGTSQTEGTIFAPQANTTEETYHFLKTQYPNLTNSTFQKLNQLYSDTPTTFSGVNRTVSPLFYRAAKLYGDASFTCPTLDFAGELSRHGVSTHLFIDHIVDPVESANGFIVPHTWELQAVWGPEYSTQYSALPGADSYDEGGINADIVPVVQAYWTSFVQTVGNPNLMRTADSPVWEEIGDGRARRFLRLQTNATEMDTVGQEFFTRCEVWESVRQEIGQ